MRVCPMCTYRVETLHLRVRSQVLRDIHVSLARRLVGLLTIIKADEVLGRVAMDAHGDACHTVGAPPRCLSRAGRTRKRERHTHREEDGTRGVKTDKIFLCCCLSFVLLAAVIMYRVRRWGICLRHTALFQQGFRFGAAVHVAQPNHMYDESSG